MYRPLFVLGLSVALSSGAQTADPTAFRQAVAPALQACSACHSPSAASGKLVTDGLEELEAFASHRVQWEKIVQRVRSGEMPPRGFPALDEGVKTAFLDAAQGALSRLDKATKLDPGRVTARRLNRNEYSNTIRDLLGVRFNAQGEFPSDDSGYGFDNIGDVLTISPILMDDYIAAAEMISRQAIGADPLPAKPVENKYQAKDNADAVISGKSAPIRRLAPALIEARHRVEWDAEYEIRIGMPGERPKGSPPARLGLWRDGELIHEMLVETGPSDLVYFDPYSEAEMRLHLAAGDSTFRAGFIDDDFVDGLGPKDVMDRDKNKFLESITFVGPYKSDVEPPSRKRLLTCDPASGAACVQQILSKLARRAYRRPATAEEVQALARFVEMAKAEGLSDEQGVQLAIQAMLVSPHFLFRIERDPDPNDPTATHRISDFELASRLSYFLWSSMPDEELLGLAEQGKLSEPAVLDAQVQRMLADGRSGELARNFAGQWLETRNLDTVRPDPDLYPSWGPELRESMKEETTLFFAEVLQKDLPLQTFLDADFTFLNDELAKHYGIEGVKGPELRKVSLADHPQRGGVLSQASVLTVTSYPTRTSAVIRGKYVLENILGAPPPDPPADIPPLEASGGDQKATVRQQLEIHRANPACATCHDRMDALGFGLENFDAIGRWRTEENELPVDASGVLPNGKSFDTPAELRHILLDDTYDFARTMTEKMLIYALGRGLEPYDRRTISEITERLAANDYHFQTLIHEIVRSAPFQMRRGERSDSPTEALAQR
ncbi:MAG: DUF1592 domain-containing protein [Acidobacteria bacterium]|nr:DUF1592 domain-containing protein [Acidobacteriota bacterium]